MEIYYKRVIARVEAGIPTKFTAEMDPRYSVKYLTPQEKLDEYKRENPSVNTTVHNKTDRQLYVGNLPPDITIPEICKHLNDALYALNLCEKEDKPIVDAWISGDGHYAFVEFRTIKDAHLGFNLTQISIHGHALKVGKPRIANSSYAMMQQQMAQQHQGNRYDDVVKINQQPSAGYINPTAMAHSTMAMSNQFDNILRNLPGPPTVGSHMSGAGYNQPMSDPTSFKSKVMTVTKLLVSNLPISYDKDQVKELLSVVGTVKNLEMITDVNTGKYKGEVYVQYEREEESRKAETSLMGMNIHDSVLHVKKVQTTTTLQQDSVQGVADSSLLRSIECGPSTCLSLTNLLIPEQIRDYEEYADVEDETFEEMEQYGKIIQVVAPRPSRDYRPGQPLEPGVGKVYVKFDNQTDALNGKEAMTGRRFEGRIVDAQFYPDDKFKRGEFA
jgi:splicing factor U2AF subunit